MLATPAKTFELAVQPNAISHDASLTFPRPILRRKPRRACHQRAPLVLSHVGVYVNVRRGAKGSAMGKFAARQRPSHLGAFAWLLATACQPQVHTDEPRSPATRPSEKTASLALPPSGANPSDSKGAPGKSARGVSSHCADGWKVDLGPYEYMNNMWAKAKAKGPYEQCLLTREGDGRTEMGWTWAWPGFDPLGFGYPEIIFGWKPWFPKSTDPRLPIRVGDVKTLMVRYDVETQATGKWALAPAAWLTRANDGNRVTARDILHEVATWIDYEPSATPIGNRIGPALVDGIDYELLLHPNEGDRGDGTGWDLYYFKRTKPSGHGIINLHSLLAYMVKAGRIQADDLVASIEFGSETQSGSGASWIRDFEIIVERK